MVSYEKYHNQKNMRIAKEGKLFWKTFCRIFVPIFVLLACVEIFYSSISIESDLWKYLIQGAPNYIIFDIIVSSFIAFPISSLIIFKSKIIKGISIAILLLYVYVVIKLIWYIFSFDGFN